MPYCSAAVPSDDTTSFSDKCCSAGDEKKKKPRKVTELQILKKARRAEMAVLLKSMEELTSEEFEMAVRMVKIYITSTTGTDTNGKKTDEAEPKNPVTPFDLFKRDSNDSVRDSQISGKR